MSEECIVAISNDLMSSAPIENAAQRAGVACHVHTIESIANCKYSPSLMLLDLNASNNVEQAVATLRKQFPGTPLVAFGPHVHAEKLKAASEAGCEQVLTRGQFHQQVGPLVANYVAK